MNDNMDEPAQDRDLTDYYERIGQASSVNRRTVKRVLLAAGHNGPPEPVPGQLTPQDCQYLSGIMKDRLLGRTAPLAAQEGSAEFGTLLGKLVGGHSRGLLPHFYEMVERFNREVIGLPIPGEPTVLSRQRAKYAREHLVEELEEFTVACASDNLDKAADAIVDLVYVALGRLVEMGIAPGPVFEEVHAANMRKRRGSVSKRPNSAGHDAVKPEGWTPPDLLPYLALTKDFLTEVAQWSGNPNSWKIRGSSPTVDPASVPGQKPGYWIPADDVERLAHRVTMEKVLQDMFPWIEHLSPVLKELTELRMKKGQDYDGGGVEIRDYFPFGHRSYAQMVHVKNLRIKSLLAVMDHGRTPNYEGLRDTLLDLLNYAVFYVEALDRGDLGPKDERAGSRVASANPHGEIG